MNSHLSAMTRSGGLSTPTGITLGPDGNLYVSSNNRPVPPTRSCTTTAA
jgi:hypothetical protein